MLYKSVEGFLQTEHARKWRWRNFVPSELACTCPEKRSEERFCEGEYWHDPEFLDALQELRERVGAPLRINSGHRCLGRNKFVGGGRRSQHLTIAADIALRPGIDREKLFHEAQRLGFRGVGRYITFIHLDRRPRQARWWGEGARGYWH